MLNSLRFNNITLFGNLEIDFDKGFTAFTGETGSGKSIFIDTLNALLVSKKTPLDNHLVEKGSTFSSIEGVFIVFPSTKDWLIKQEIDVDDDLIVTREWRLKENKYKSRFRINGVLVNRDQISKLRSFLLDFTLQGDTYTLNDSLYQLNLLDSLGLNKLKELISHVNQDWKSWHECHLKFNEAKNKIIDSKKQFEEMEYIYQDLEKLRREKFKVIQTRSQWIVAGIVFASPVASTDLLAVAVVNGLMIKEMSKIWSCKMKPELLEAVSRQLAMAAIGQGVVEWSGQSLLSLAKLDGSSWVAAGTIQALSAAYLTRVVGRSTADWMALNNGVTQPDLELIKQQAPQLVSKAAELERVDWVAFLKQSKEWIQSQSENYKVKSV